MIRRVFAAALIVATALVLLVLAWPQLFSLEQTPLVIQVVALRGLVAGIAVLGAVALLLVALLSRAARRFAASVAVLLLAFATFNGIVIADRGVGDIAFETKGPNDLTVLTWNTLGDAPGPQALADLALEQDADVITLPETTVEFGTAVESIMDAAGKPMQVISANFDLISKARSTTMLVTEALGPYAQVDPADSTGQLPSIVATPVSGSGPTLVAVHPVAPIPGELTTWHTDLDWLAKTCVGENVIMAGDFNSTLDHFSALPHESGATIGDCTDAGALSGNAGVGTWPASLPPLLGTPIDHVMLTDNWRVSGMRVVESLDGAGSDHRPVLVQLSPNEK